MTWIVVCLIAAAAVGPLDAKEIVERQSFNILNDLPINNKELMSEEKAGLELHAEKRGECKLKFPCELSGGHCVTNAKDCRYGKLIASGCGGKGCQCCIPGCPEDQGFFMLPHPSNQCFKLFEKPGTWSAGKATCHDAGLVLARPLETIALKNYLTLRYGDLSNTKVSAGMPVTAWLDAVTDGHCMKWNRGPYGCISSSLPIWWPGQPIVAKGRCLLLTSNFHDWKNNPEKSLYALPCHVNDRVPLCELLM